MGTRKAIAAHKRAVQVACCIAVATLTAWAGTAQADDGWQRSGTFSGRSDHVVTGGVTVTSRAGETVVVLDENFSLDGAPDPKLGFGADGSAPARLFSPLREIAGAQFYVLPADVDAEDVEGLYVWCEEFSVPLGYASLR